MPDQSKVPMTQEEVEGVVRRVSVTNSVWQSLPESVRENVSRKQIKHAVERGEQTWQNTHLKTLRPTV